MLSPDKYLRQLAKSNKHQLLYGQCKEAGLCLFENRTDLTDVQLRYLTFLNFYASLYMDYALGEVDFIVFKNNTYEDAYQHYKINKHKKDMNTTKIDDIKKNSDKLNKINEFSWVFKRPPKA